ncbi:MAG: c-type cytochrome, partial [Mesorhizobium sp.]
HCVQCHGSGAQGSAGFPNLNDDDWLWGGNAEQLEQTIMHGIRFASNPDTRQSEMPAFGDIITGDQIKQVSAYVASLSGPVQDKGLIEPGAKVFAENCVACHDANAKGNREFGAPDLTDAIWLYGSGEMAIAAQV